MLSVCFKAGLKTGPDFVFYSLHNPDYLMTTSSSSKSHSVTSLEVSRSITLYVCTTSYQNPLNQIHTCLAQPPVLFCHCKHTHSKRTVDPHLSSPQSSTLLVLDRHSRHFSVHGWQWAANNLATMNLAKVRDIVKVLEVVLFLAAKGVTLTGWCESRSLSCELHIKVTDVFFSSNGWQEWRRYFPLKKCLPVHTLNKIHIKLSRLQKVKS